MAIAPAALEYAAAARQAANPGVPRARVVLRDRRGGWRQAAFLTMIPIEVEA
jgi:hypothetical protein